MNKDVKAKWVEALRSGYYKQGKYKLRDLGDYYDATGVLCDLAANASVIGSPTRYDAPDGIFFGYTYGDAKSNDSFATGLPRAVREWAGIEYRLAYRVALMGDEGKTFNQIADYIEENL